MREISREGILLAGGGRALLLQLAHPAVGAGVANHSDFARDPLKRLHGTLMYVYAVASGTATDAAAARRAVNHAHIPVRGPGYSASDPALQLWVAATLYDSALQVYERVFGPLDEDTAESVYREYAALGTALQMPAELWPTDRAAFRTYFDEQVAQLSVDDTVRRIARTLLSPATLPAWLRVLSPTLGAITSELLPTRVRVLYGMREKYGSLDRLSRFYRAMPGLIRTSPRHYYLKRLRTQPIS